MKRVLYTMPLLFSLAAQAQVGVEKIDSMEMGDNYANDVYYQLLDGAKKTESNTNWQVAFQVGGQTDGIRINTATAMGAGNGNAEVYVYPSGVIADWAAFDSAGYASWQKLENSDEFWSLGALNTTAGTFPDFGWGTYNMTTHVVTGDSIYFIKFISNGNTYFRKFYVNNKTSGNWTFTYGLIDGSWDTTVTVESADYTGKNFIYFNLETHAALDREPESWDFVSTRYNALQGNGSYAAATGILINGGILVASAEGKEAADLELADSTEGFSDLMNVIGYDWKYYTMGGMGVEWHTEDSLAYFIQDNNGALWKVVFTAFTGGTRGKTVFSKTQLTPGTAVSQPGNKVQTSVYPNPSTGKTQLLISSEAAGRATIRVMDLSGRLVQEYSIQAGAGLEVFNLDLSGLNNGVYFIQVAGSGFSSTQKLIKN